VYEENKQMEIRIWKRNKRSRGRRRRKERRKVKHIRRSN
jgi:hypothetical protein